MRLNLEQMSSILVRTPHSAYLRRAVSDAAPQSQSRAHPNEQSGQLHMDSSLSSPSSLEAVNRAGQLMACSVHVIALLKEQLKQP